MEYKVEWTELWTGWANVEAESEEEAIAKAKRGEIIEGTQDSDPGNTDPKSFNIV